MIVSEVPRPSNVSISYELVRNADYWPYPRPTEAEILEVELAVCVLRSPPDDTDNPLVRVSKLQLVDLMWSVTWFCKLNYTETQS